jgi:glycosyltransferase involved in cell wall biosynthesis
MTSQGIGDVVYGAAVNGRVRASVDVLMTAYNSAATIVDSARSILNQTFRDLRLIVVDDGSTDATASLLVELARDDARVTVLTQGNAGIVAAANAGLQLCTADLVARMDSDDLAFPDRIEKQVQFMRTHPGCVAVSCLVHHIDVEGRRLGSVAGRLPALGPDEFTIPSREPYIMHPFVLMRRSALTLVGGYRHVDFAEDTDLYWRLMEIGGLEVIEEYLGEYRVHESSVSSRSIVHGRVSAMNSQRAAISTQRRRAGSDDMRFDASEISAWKAAQSFDAMLSRACRTLSQMECEYLRFSAAAKLLELNSYRPYELEASDCTTLKSILGAHHQDIVAHYPEVRRHWGIACARLIRKGYPRRALLLFHNCILKELAKAFFIQVLARLLPLSARKMYRQARARAAA